MNDNEIKKALHICAEHEPFEGQQYTYCGIPLQLLFKEILAFVNRKQAEIDRLNCCVKSEDEVRAIMKAQMEPVIKEATNEMFDRAVKVARADAVIDFAESFKKLSRYSVMVDGDREIPGTRHYSISEISLDKLVKEKLGDAE